MSARTYADLIADCVHCGFCLPACPTYVSWGEEMDSPRGRIDLMRGVEDGTIALDGVVTQHIDACLGCMACVTACPSGVRYDLLIEATRAKVEEQVPRTPGDRAFRALVFALFPYPGRLRALAPLLWLTERLGLRSLIAGPLGRALPLRLRQLVTVAPPVALGATFAPLPERTPAVGERRARVALVAGCVQRTFFPGVNAATLRVLAAEGCEVVVPRGQGCCGALSLHGGRLEEAKRFARALITRFEAEPVDAILVNAAGCGSSLKEYGGLLAGEPAWSERAAAFAARVQDVNEYLATLAPRAPRRCRCGSPITTPVTWRTRSACARSRARCYVRSPTSSWSRSRPASSAVGARGLTTSSRRPRRARSARARSTTCCRSRRICWPAPTQAARCRSDRCWPNGACGSRPRTRSRSWTPRSAARRYRTSASSCW
jgi:glycolate oxidase iron-sulfur subunit